MWRKRQKDKEKKKKIKKKRLGLKLKLMLLLGSLPTMMIIVIVLGSSILLFSLTSLLAGTLWDNFADDPIEEEHGELCECGCIWVADGINGEEVVEVEDVSSGSGVDVSSLKLLGTAEMSWYSFADNDDGAGNFGTVATASGANATSGITVAMADEYTIPGGDIMEKLGVELGDWIYIENIGVRQIQDRCGTSGRVDVFVNSDEAETKKYRGSVLKIYLVQKGGTIQKGSQDGVQIPQVTSTTTQVPSYGHATGSITDTSKQIPNFKYGEKSETVINAFLVGSVVSYQLYGVYPSVMIGQKIGESGYSIDSSIPNNFYGIKADSSWTGDKGLYWTTEYSGGTSYKVQAWFRHYPTFDEGVLAHGEFLVANSRYEKAGVFNASSGYEQIQYIKDAGYATDPNYVTYIRAIMDANSLSWFDDYNNAVYYMQEKGLYQNYLDLVAGIKDGSIKVHENANLSNLDGMQSGGNNGSSISTGKGHWVCACERPCKNCDCHDNETEGDGQNGAGSSAVFPEAVAGQASGLWGTTQQLVGYIAALNSMNMPNGVTNIDRLRENLNNLVGYMGMEPADPFHYEYDKFNGPDGWGFVHYRQGLSSLEPFNKKPYNDGSGKATFSSSGCGLYATAMALSTLEKKWVSPAEVAIALQTYGVRNGVRINTTLMGGSGAAYIDGLYKLIVEAGFNSTVLDMDKGLVQSEVDKCLDAGGLIIYVTNDPNLTGSGHYVVIRDRTSSGMYLLGDSVKQNNNEFTFNRLKQYDKNGAAIYIYPKPGESIFDRLASNNNSGSVSSDKAIYPVDNPRKTSGWYRDDGVTFHGGIDYGAQVQGVTGDPIKAIWDGVVVHTADGYGNDANANDGGGYGNNIIIRHNNGTWSLYAHLSPGLNVKEGDTVKQGQVIAKMGNSGSSSNAHLHIEVRLTDENTYPRTLINPEKLFEGYSIAELAQRNNPKSGGALLKPGIE